MGEKSHTIETSEKIIKRKFNDVVHHVINDVMKNSESNFRVSLSCLTHVGIGDTMMPKICSRGREWKLMKLGHSLVLEYDNATKIRCHSARKN